ncbi:MAG: hypothetical protein IT363_08270 [Methanoregulaceae archaeon]|nr:hypothetical protein [Methanoregulaceae archaeon]
MAIRAFEERIQVEIDAVEALPTAPGDGDDARSAYPLPRLRKLGGRERHEFIAIVLENNWVRATLVPALGGRVLSLQLNGTECLGVERDADGVFLLNLTPSLTEGSSSSSGMGSLELFAGLEITLRGRARRQSLAPLDVQLVEPGHEEDEAVVILGELDPGSSLSWHARISLAANEAALRVGVKVFNRDLAEAGYSSGLRWTGNIGVFAEPGVLPNMGAQFADRAGATLGPRLVDNWEAMVIPVPEPPRGVSSVGAVLVRSFLPVVGAPGARVLIQDSAGETLDATFDLEPGHAIDLPEFQAFQIRDAHKQVVAEWPAPEPDPDLLSLKRDLLHPDRRAATLIALAYRAITADDLGKARQLVDDALGHNQEDHLAWWLRAALHRGESEHDLPNAHFLAPMEPLLRAESFLAMAVNERDPNPLIAPLADDPDALIEVAVRLGEAGLKDDLARWIDEALRHREVPMLRYILADALLQKSRMAVEAADHVARVAKAPINPPYPWRSYERAVLERLGERFPDDARIAELRQMMREFA